MGSKMLCLKMILMLHNCTESAGLLQLDVTVKIGFKSTGTDTRSTSQSYMELLAGTDQFSFVLGLHGSVFLLYFAAEAYVN